MAAFYRMDFESPVALLDQQIEQLEADLRRAAAPQPVAPDAPARPADSANPPPTHATLSDSEAAALAARIDALRLQRLQTLEAVYADLSAINVVRVARHPKRPQTRDYIDLFCKDFCELHGDRRFGDDPAMVTGFARIGHHRVLVVGHQKGRTTQEKIACHFGCAHPEGYRKALAKMKMAAKFRIPIVTFVDTPGAYPGIGAEQRGQAEAIATNLLEMSRLPTPVVSVVIGEGGSGGALGIAVADRVAMLSFAWYSVISPEGCAAILWKQANETTNAAAAAALRLTARDNLDLGIIDTIIQEPTGAAHRDPEATGRAMEKWIADTLAELKSIPTETLTNARYERFRKMGAYIEASPVGGAPAR
jgi:acetyl-CoA carboxylase carboxyl transferase subunit alpha